MGDEKDFSICIPGAHSLSATEPHPGYFKEQGDCTGRRLRKEVNNHTREGKNQGKLGTQKQALVNLCFRKLPTWKDIKELEK